MADYEPKFIALSSEWLSDGIGESYKQWQCRRSLSSATRVFIQSPTGTGKTSFIIDKLYLYAAENGRNILYLGNRVALKEQTERSVKAHFQACQSDVEIDRDGEAIFLRHPNSDASLTLLNYQAFLGFSRQYYDPVRECYHNPFYYVILDEAHFFMEDSLFNPMTDLILRRLMQWLYDSVFVFMSATMEESSTVLLTALSRFHPPSIKSVPYFASHQVDAKLYKNKVRKGRYNVLFFEDQSQIVEEIRNTPKNEKWLIFVTSKQTANQLHREITHAGDRVLFLSAEKKSGRAWEELVEHATFQERVLISTKVLDNGVNIHDPAVMHIVLPFCARPDFLQMLGRRRMEHGDMVQLYVAVPQIQQINTQLHRVREMKAAVEQVLRAGERPEKITRLLQTFWLSGKQHINSLFFIDEDRNLCPNMIAYEKIKQLEVFYSDLAKHGNDPSYYPGMILSWLGDRVSGESKFLGMGDCRSLEEFMACHLDKPIDDSEQDRFYAQFQRLYKQHCYTLYRDDPEKLKTALSIRKGKTQRKATMNKGLAVLRLPYEVKKEQNCWVLRQKTV